MTAALLGTAPSLPMSLPEIDARQVQIALIYHAHLLAAAIELGIDAKLFAALPSRGRMVPAPEYGDVFRARRYAIYLTVTEYDRPGKYAGLAAGISKQAVSKLLRQVEDARDNPATEALLTRIAARAAGRHPGQAT